MKPRSPGRRAGALVAGASAALLAACGGPSGGGPAAAVGGGPHWDRADACKTVDGQAVAAAAGAPVKEVTSVPATSGASGAWVASCSYDLGGPAATVMTRVSTDDLSDKQIEEMRTAGGALPPGEDVPGLGMRASWSPQMRQLQIRVDRKHYAAVAYSPALTLPGAPPPAGPEPKAFALAIAKRLVG